MSILLLYGQPGTGKSTLATGIALDYLREGRRVVSNFAIDPAPACSSRHARLANGIVEVLPARPTFAQIQALGIGWKDPKLVGREDLAGLLLIDEAGPLLDARRWNDKERPQLIDWFLHSRKRGWDIVFIAQAPGLVDKQVREAVVETYARVRRTDRMRVPFIGVKLPRLHVAVARYGLEQNAPVLQHWWYRGTLEHKCFQSYALFDSENQDGAYSVLPPRLTKFRGPEPWWDRCLGFLRRDVRQLLPAAHQGDNRTICLKGKLPHVERAMRLPADQRIPALRLLGVA